MRMGCDGHEPIVDFDAETRTIFLIGDINQNSAGVFSLAMHQLNKSEGPITVMLTSEGGDERFGMVIFDTIKLSPNDVTIKVMSVAFSMGAFIMLAADRRVMTSNSMLLFHQGSTTIQDSSATVFLAAAEELKYSLKKMIKIVSEHSKLNLKEAEKLVMAESYLDSKQALKLGLIDEVEYV